MSLRYKGGVISATPPTTSVTSASGNWTLEQQMQAQGAGTWPFGGPFTYIEDVFSTYLYTGNGYLSSNSQTITNGIDLSTYGGLVWIKDRTTAYSHALFDTVRGTNKRLVSNSTAAQQTDTDTLTAFGSTGFTVGADLNGTGVNISGEAEVSWTFRKQPKFFDVVTYTGTGSATTIAHNLGSTPGCIIVKCTSAAYQWAVYHRSLGGTKYLLLNSTQAVNTVSSFWNDTDPTSTNFTVGTSPNTNNTGDTFVAYLFAHDAGGFGLTGTDNVISCGSFTTDGSGGATVNLGYEPQWVMAKRTSGVEGWFMFDNMRGFTGYTGSNSGNQYLYANTSGAEQGPVVGIGVTATGFQSSNFFTASSTYIYIAIRRGPMKTPTSGTSVFNTVFRNASAGLPQWNSGFVTDFSIVMDRDGSGNIDTVDRLRGTKRLLTYSTAAESNGSPNTLWDYMNGFGATSGSLYDRQLAYMYRRAPGFFDVVCYTGDGTANRAITHNLTVAPELLICKSRDVAGTFWRVLWTGSLANSLNLNGTSSWADLTGNAPFFFGNGTTSGSATAPTASNFYVANEINQNTKNIVAYLFATVPGVSKVGTFTGNGTSQTINCGFTTGARFVLVKATSTTGNWLVVDTARGLVAAGDPTLYLNSTAAEVTGADWIDPDASGFIVNQEATMNANASGVSYLFLAIS